MKSFMKWLFRLFVIFCGYFFFHVWHRFTKHPFQGCSSLIRNRDGASLCLLIPLSVSVSFLESGWEQRCYVLRAQSRSSLNTLLFKVDVCPEPLRDRCCTVKIESALYQTLTVSQMRERGRGGEMLLSASKRRMRRGNVIGGKKS